MWFQHTATEGVSVFTAKGLLILRGTGKALPELELVCNNPDSVPPTFSILILSGDNSDSQFRYKNS